MKTKMSKALTYILLVVMITGLFVPKIVSADSETNLINMSFKDADLRDIFRTIAELSEVNLITDSAIKNNITINLSGITFEKALDLLCETNNLAYKIDGDVVVVSTPERIEEIYHQLDLKILKVKHNNLSNIKSIVNGIYPELNLQIDESNNQMIVTGIEEKIILAEKLISHIDIRQKKNNITQVIALKENADFSLSSLEKLYSNLDIVRINNHLIMQGTEVNVKEARSVLKNLDLLTDNDTPQNIYDITTVEIKYADVKETAELLQNIYPELNIQQDKWNRQLIIVDNQGKSKEAIKMIEKLDNPRGNEDKATISNPEPKEIVQVIPVDHTAPENIIKIINKIYPEVDIVSDEENKKLILVGLKERLSASRELISQLNVPQKQVIIEARVEEIARNELTTIGIDPDDLSQIQFIHNDNNQISGVELTLPHFLKVLRDTGKSKTLANPRMMTLNGKEARLLIGDKVPIKLEKTQDGQQVSSIEYIEAGVNLEFTPWITAENEIILEVAPKVSSLGPTVADGLPRVNTREAETAIRLKDGQMIVIGGLIQEDEVESMSQVPVLSEIPVLGELFKYSRRQDNDTELLILITPRIVGENLPEETGADKIHDNLSGQETEDKNKMLETISEKKADLQEAGLFLILAGLIYNLAN
ncbi:MAG: secretin N-terminal domain-containing protein [Halanaerobiaceae bacterium]